MLSLDLAVGLRNSFRRGRPARHQQLRHESRPASLMRRADPAPTVAVEIFVKEQQVAPVRGGLELFLTAVNRAAIFAVAREEFYHAVGEALRQHRRAHAEVAVGRVEQVDHELDLLGHLGRDVQEGRRLGAHGRQGVDGSRQPRGLEMQLGAHAPDEVRLRLEAELRSLDAWQMKSIYE